MATKWNAFTNNLDITSDADTLVVGPAVSTDNAIARFDGTTGKLLQNSGSTLSDGNLLSTGELNLSTVLDTQYGGTGASSFTAGAYIVGAGGGVLVALDGTAKGSIPIGDGATTPTILSVGSNGQVLTVDDSETSGVKWGVVAGTGDVSAAANLTDNAVVRGDGGAKGVQDSGILIDDSDVVTGVTQLNVDNLRLDGNIVSSTDTNGNITLSPDGTGVVNTTAALSVKSTTGETDITIAGTTIDGSVFLHAEGAVDLGELVIERHTDTAGFGAHQLMARTRGNEASETAVQSGDLLGQTVYLGHDGTDFAQAANIKVEVDTTPGDGDMPGRIIMMTSADGAETPIEGLRLDSSQVITLANALPVGSGGTGATSLTDGGVLLGSGVGAITALGQATNGQLVIGSTGADPVVASVASTDGTLTITEGAGTLVIEGTAATDTQAGVIELATDAETNTGTATDRALTPANITAWTGDTALVTTGTIGTGTWEATDVGAAHGGTGRSSHTAYAVICGGTTSTAAQQSIASVGSSGEVLTSNGAGALPTFQAGGSGDVTAAANMTDNTLIKGDGGAKGVQDSGVTLSDTDALSGILTLAMAGNLTIYEPTNDGNPEILLGSADAEELHIQAVYDGGAQTLDYVLLQTDAASATANKGLFRFNVDGADICDIDDGGIDLDTGMALSIAGADVLDATTLGGAVVASSLTSVGTIATGVWNGTGVTEVYGGTGQTSYTKGDILYASDTNVLSVLPIGTDNYVLTVATDVPAWEAASGGGGMTWNEETGTSATMAVNNGYLANNAGLVTLTLPTTAAVGDIVAVAGSGAGGWLVAQNASEIIHFVSTDSTTGAGGSLASTNRYDCVELICNVANTEWVVRSSTGNITIV